MVTPKAAPPVVLWLLGVVWLFWLRVALLTMGLLIVAERRTAGQHGTPLVLYRHCLLRHRQRHFQPAVVFAYIREAHGGPRSSASVPLMFFFASLMVSTATVILGGIPAALYERYIGAKDDST